MKKNHTFRFINGARLRSRNFCYFTYFDAPAEDNVDPLFERFME